MIIRRKHTGNFATISNSLANDERLKVDEVGMLYYLLTRPHDWEVRRAQLGKRFGLGREAIKRIIWSAMRTGWIVAERTRLEDGRIFTTYEIRDEPGSELSDDEIRRALSLGSSEALDGASDDNEPGSDAAADPPPTGQPSTGQPATGEPATGNPYVASKKEDTKNRFTNNGGNKSAREFGDVKAAWPLANILSSTASQKAFLSLSDVDREACFLGERPYLDDCHAQRRPICDLRTYITERRWERLSDLSGKPKMVSVPYGSPNFYRWREHLQAIGKWSERSESAARTYGHLAVPDLWPPARGESQPGKNDAA